MARGVRLGLQAADFDFGVCWTDDGAHFRREDPLIGLVTPAPWICCIHLNSAHPAKKLPWTRFDTFRRANLTPDDGVAGKLPGGFGSAGQANDSVIAE